MGTLALRNAALETLLEVISLVLLPTFEGDASLVSGMPFVSALKSRDAGIAACKLTLVMYLHDALCLLTTVYPATEAQRSWLHCLAPAEQPPKRSQHFEEIP